MKILIVLLFLAVPSYAQHFMMHMDVQTSSKDTTIYQCNVKVIWGIQEDEICFLWGDWLPMCFAKRKNERKLTRKMRERREEFIDKMALMEKGEDIKLRDIYINQWGEMYLITIYMNNSVWIVINRLDDKYPHYMFRMTHN